MKRMRREDDYYDQPPPPRYGGRGRDPYPPYRDYPPRPDSADEPMYPPPSPPPRVPQEMPPDEPPRQELMSFREFVMRAVGEDLGPEEAKAEYERYLADFYGDALRAEFEQTKDDDRIRDKYDPRRLAQKWEAKLSAAKAAMLNLASDIADRTLDPDAPDFCQGCPLPAAAPEQQPAASAAAGAGTGSPEPGDSAGDAAAAKEAGDSSAPAAGKKPFAPKKHRHGNLIAWAKDIIESDVRMSRKLISKLDEEKGLEFSACPEGQHPLTSFWAAADALAALAPPGGASGGSEQLEGGDREDAGGEGPKAEGDDPQGGQAVADEDMAGEDGVAAATDEAAAGNAGGADDAAAAEDADEAGGAQEREQEQQEEAMEQDEQQQAGHGEAAAAADAGKPGSEKEAGSQVVPAAAAAAVAAKDELAEEVAPEVLLQLDMQLTYLWRVHGCDFYAGIEHRSTALDGQQAQMRLRKVRPPKTGKPVSSTDAKRWRSQYDREVTKKWRSRLEAGDPEAAHMHADEVDRRVAEWIEAQVVQHDEKKWGNKLSNKKFVSKEFVIKHIQNKQKPAVDAERNRILDELYFKNFKDAKHEEQLRQEELAEAQAAFEAGMDGDDGGRGWGGDKGRRGGRGGRGGFSGGGRGMLMDLGGMMPGIMPMMPPVMMLPGPAGPVPLMMPMIDPSMMMGEMPGGGGGRRGPRRGGGRGGGGGPGMPGMVGFPGGKIDPRGFRGYHDLDAPRHNRGVINYDDL